MVFSILIPVYNVEEYLQECIESVLKQTEKSFEIILLDDHSTDNSGALCDEYAAKYPDKIRVFHNESNEGLLLARRKLFELSLGEWILCIDSDDYIEETTLETVRNTFEKYNADMVMFNLMCTHIDGHTEIFQPCLQQGYVYKDEEKDKIYEALTKNKYANSLCTKAYKRTLIDIDVDYTLWKELRIGEDLFQSYPLWDNSRKVVYIDKTLYYYRKNEKSMTSQLPVDFYKRRKALWERDDYYAKKWGVSGDTINVVTKQRISEIMDYIRTVAVLKDTSNIESFICEINEDKLLTEYVAKLSHGLGYRDKIIYQLVKNNRFSLLRTYCHTEKLLKSLVKTLYH